MVRVWEWVMAAERRGVARLDLNLFTSANYRWSGPGKAVENKTVCLSAGYPIRGGLNKSIKI